MYVDRRLRKIAMNKHRIDDFHVSQDPDYINHKDLLSGMRWLYEDEADYERAKKKMASEIYREEVKKLLAKKVRTEKRQQLTDGLANTTKNALNSTYGFFQKVFRKKVFFAASGAAVLALSIIFILNRASEKPRSDILGQNKNEPAYDTLLPNGSAKNTVSGRAAYDSEKQVASYADDIGKVSATVSQQTLPEKFQNNPEREISKLAQRMGATEKLEAGNTTAYLSSSEKLQRVLFTKNQLLVFITANEKLDDAQLLNYIDSLK